MCSGIVPKYLCAPSPDDQETLRESFSFQIRRPRFQNLIVFPCVFQCNTITTLWCWTGQGRATQHYVFSVQNHIHHGTVCIQDIVTKPGISHAGVEPLRHHVFSLQHCHHPVMVCCENSIIMLWGCTGQGQATEHHGFTYQHYHLYVTICFHHILTTLWGCTGQG